MDRSRGAVLRYETYSEHVTAATKMEHLANQNPLALDRVLNRQKVHPGKTKALAIVEMETPPVIMTDRVLFRAVQSVLSAFRFVP